MLRGKYLRERKALRTKRRIKTIALLAIIMVLYKLIFGTLSTYRSDAYSSADIDVAYFIVRDEYSEENTIQLSDLEPGEELSVNIGLYNFELDDDNNQDITEVDMHYWVTIRTTTNLQFEYRLLYQGTSAVNQSEYLDEQDGDETWFKYLVKSEGTSDTTTIFDDVFTHDSPQSREYTLVIKLPETYDSYVYQNIMDAIEIKVEAEQVIDD